MNPRTWKLIALLLLVAFLSLLGYTFVMHRAGSNASQDTIVLQVQRLSQLVTVRYRIQRVVGMTEEKQPVGEESILLMVEGEVQAGIDLHKVTSADVAADDTGALTLTLPPSEILNASIDEKKTKVWDRHITWWTPWVAPDPDLEHKARLKALDDIRQAAIEMGALDQARANAQSALGDLFGALGWKVKVKVKGLD
ncbi:MAG TPA: DUF4230 domain-containing protein [Bryobacteraceae bacterium]|jgi:hypothetical protein|nr:DUF4230 domain-containing protein [Bryobacteraceae bacterium]